MEKALQNILCDLLGRHAGIIPSLDNEVDRVLDNRLSDFTRGLIEDQSEMVLKSARSQIARSYL